jgi:predicted GTPase
MEHKQEKITSDEALNAEGSELDLSNLMRMQKEKQYHHLLQLNVRIDGDQKSLSDLVGKNIIYLFGQTGCGKSTLANALINGSSSMLRDANGLIENIDLLKALFKIGHSVKSQTKTPVSVNIDNSDSHLVDSAGINDSNFRHEYANQLCTKFLLKKCMSYVIVLVINSNELIVSNGASFIQLLTSIVRKFKKEATDQEQIWKSVIIPIFVKFSF